MINDKLLNLDYFVHYFMYVNLISIIIFIIFNYSIFLNINWGRDKKNKIIKIKNTNYFFISLLTFIFFDIIKLDRIKFTLFTF
jgi:hypothetical protein